MSAPSSSGRGRLFLISAPSGAGKTSLVRRLEAEDPALCFSISYTTRQRRPSEVDGRDYFFVDMATFEAMAARGEFLEHAVVFGNCYGTSRRQVEQLLVAGRSVLVEIDWQGAAQVRTRMPDAVSIFILPPSRAELERRLHTRRTDSTAEIQRRMADARAEMSHWSEFDYVVVNDDFDTALAELERIVAGDGEASRCDRPQLVPLVEELLA